MKAHRKPSKTWLFALITVALLGIIATVESYQGAQAATGESVAATYSQGVLHVSIPYHAPHPGQGELTVEVLDPEDQVLGRAQRRVDAGDAKGVWQEDLKLTKTVAVDDLVWHRLRYRFTYSDHKDPTLQGAESISEILRRPVLHILGQQSYLTGAEAAVRVISTDSKNEAIAGASSVRIDLMAPNTPPRALFAGRLNGRGTTEAQFRFPAGLVGSYPVRYLVDTPIGSTEFTQQVRLEDKVAILLNTEKPIYQPGQTIHVRALALDRSNHEASAGRSLTFEVEDSRGNKVFKTATQTSKFGIASAEFSLADEVNLGTYHLRALMDGNTAQVALNVERYVLPKFKVAVDFGGDGAKGNQAKHGYRPGEHVTGTVRSNYFFGKPVDGAEITVKASAMDVAQFEAASVHGRTDADGAYRFDLKLPDYFAGRPLNQGAARVLIEATVKDSASHSETRGEPVTVSESPLIITAVPEGGTLVPNLENQVFILTSYADGKPATADVKVPGINQSVSTDAGGVAVIRLKPGAGTETLWIDASDKEGNHASGNVPLQARAGVDQILLRTERAVYRAGDRIQLKVFSTKATGAAYIDVVKEGQTVLTRDLDIVNGQADLSLTATPYMAGTLDFNAYLFGRDARPVADHRLVFVQPADELKIEATASAAVYKPGDDAQVRFRVTNARGEGVQAALGLQVVDEAVFALAEKQPGFAKVFFYLEQEAMKPRYEIHSIGMPEIVEPVVPAKAAQRDRAARALFAATETVSANKFETEVGRTVPQVKRAQYFARYQSRFQAQVTQLAERLSQGYAKNPEGGDLTKVRDRLASGGAPELRDAWNTAIRLEPVQWNRQYLLVRSAGPDRQFNTGDDLTGMVQVLSETVAGRPSSGAVDLDIEHDRGPFNGLAEVAASVVDQSGAAVAGAAITVREVNTGKVHTAASNNAGQFRLAGLPAGEYEIKISRLGFQLASREFALLARDRAVFKATLRVDSTTETLVVSTGFGAGGGIGSGNGGGFGPQFQQGQQGGQMGGVMGGIIGGNLRALGAIGPPMEAARKFAPADAVMVSPHAGIMFASAGANTATVALDTIGAAPVPRVRSYFPEALYINPQIITDQDGRATISIPMADSITTWRMAMLASTAHGALGSRTSSLKVFQDFFVDLDMPVTVTQGDQVSIPVAAYNYSGSAGNVSLQLQKDDWFTLVNDVPDKSLTVESGRVGSSQFTLQATRIGKFKLTLSARMAGGSKRADIVVREIEVIPDGREQNIVFNGRLDTAVHHDVNFPAASIPDASKVIVRLYPGPLSQVIEGMDSILRMPGGCFEQTSSSTYPNVLALDYMKRTGKLTPEVHAKAEGFIANGYQRLLTFEVPGGGFSWFGSAPANKILTSYGLMEFFDMSKVHEVDPKVIQRTQQWLAAQQQPDGSWKPDANFINEGATNRYNSDALRITAYIAWALENTGYQGPAVEKARQFVQQNLNAKPDAYTLAVLANFATDYGKDRAFTNQAMKLLLDAAHTGNEQTWWTSEETGVYGGGASAAVETTGLAVQALLKWGGDSGAASKALTYISSKKDATGAWGSTQATIMALRALLLASEKGSADVRGTVEVSLNGKTVETLTLTPDNNDLLHQFVFSGAAANTVDIRFTGKGGLAYQVVGQHFLPWKEKPPNEPLSIDVSYDRTRLSQDDIATATATVKNNLTKSANMVMVDLGIPPGFDLLSEDLQDYQEKSAGRKSGHLEKFSMTATQAILYFDAIAPGDAVKLSFRLRAKYPVRARTFQSRVYEYYDPAVSAVARPVQVEVTKK